MADSNSTVETAVEYREIPGWPGYRVGDDGSIWRLWVTCKSGRKLGNKWRPMKLATNGRGYLSVNLTPPEGGRYQTLRVHRLVLLAFVGPCPEGMECRHLDGDKANAALRDAEGNIRLAWGTPEENRQDNRDLGAYRIGARHQLAVLTEDAVRSIRQRYAAGGVFLRELAEEHNVALTTVQAIIKRRSWTHID